MSKKVKKEIGIIWMIPKEEFNRRFTLAVNEFYKNYPINEVNVDNIVKESILKSQKV